MAQDRVGLLAEEVAHRHHIFYVPLIFAEAKMRGTILVVMNLRINKKKEIAK